MADQTRMRIKPIMSLDREPSATANRWSRSRDARRTPIASLRISRLGAAAMAPPEGPPARSGEATGLLCATGTSIQPDQNSWQKAKAQAACGQSKTRAPARDE
jgi:hypothetical protein